jgi:hypothetical protein
MVPGGLLRRPSFEKLSSAQPYNAFGSVRTPRTCPEKGEGEGRSQYFHPQCHCPDNV